MQADRAETEWRTRAEEDASREKAKLRSARASLESERAELLRRVATAESVGQTREAEVLYE